MLVDLVRITASLVGKSGRWARLSSEFAQRKNGQKQIRWILAVVAIVRLRRVM